MEIYLPVAQLAVNSFTLLGIGLTVGFLSGMLGVSGGFITTPLLIFYGIPSGIAVASQASPVAAAALVGAIRQGGKKSVDYKMGLWLLFGGLVGSALGVAIFRLLQTIGQIDFVIKLSYLILLGTGGAFILIPAKVYLLRMRTSLAIGTSQFQMFIVACMATVLHSAVDHTVDIVLALILVIGGVVGAQFGIRAGARLRAEELRSALALLIIAIAVRLFFEMVLTPSELFSVITSLG